MKLLVAGSGFREHCSGRSDRGRVYLVRGSIARIVDHLSQRCLFGLDSLGTNLLWKIRAEASNRQS
jgi:hypothetical protein